MFKTIKNIFRGTDTNTGAKRAEYVIIPARDNRFALWGPEGMIKTYGRKRDALRGAERMGITARVA